MKRDDIRKKRKLNNKDDIRKKRVESRQRKRSNMNRSNRIDENRNKKTLKSIISNIPTFKIVLYLLLFILFLVVYRIYSFNNTNTNVDIFHTDIKKESKYIGVLDNRYYKLEDNKFSSHNKNSEKFSINVLNISGVIYDKYIYISEKSGRIKMINRSNGEEIKLINLDHKIDHFKKINNNLIAFGESEITVLDRKLEIIDNISDLTNPVLYDFNNSKEAYVEMDLINGNISSIFTVKNKDNTQFSISSTNEVFIYTKIVGEDTILLSNRYIYLINGNSIIKKVLLEDISAIDYNYKQLAVVDSGILKIFDDNLDLKESKSVGKDIKSLSIRKNSIVILGEKHLSVYENGNVVDVNIKNPLGSYSDDQAFYIIFSDRIEKVNAY